MELNPVSFFAHNTLRVLFRGIEEPIFYSVTYEAARKAVDTLLFGDEESDDPLDEVHYVQVPLLNGGLLLMQASHIILLQHLYDYGIMGYPPGPNHFGVPELEDDEDEAKEWYHPSAVFGLEHHGIITLPVSSGKELSMLGDSVTEGFFMGLFVDFIDEDGETNVVGTEYLAFALVMPDEE